MLVKIYNSGIHETAGAAVISASFNPKQFL